MAKTPIENESDVAGRSPLMRLLAISPLLAVLLHLRAHRKPARKTSPRLSDGARRGQKFPLLIGVPVGHCFIEHRFQWAYATTPGGAAEKLNENRSFLLRAKFQSMKEPRWLIE